jgi:ATP-dependent Clp protease ATP-binding subunit ClpA
MFERFSEGSQAALVEAQGLALELASRGIETTHLLYGLAEGREETAGRPLRDCGISAMRVRRMIPRAEQISKDVLDAESLLSIGIDVDGVRAVVEETFGTGALASAPDRRVSSGSSRRPRFTPEAKRSLENGLRVAIELHDNKIKPGHLLLGLLRINDPFVAVVLQATGTSVAGLSSDVLTQLGAT